MGFFDKLFSKDKKTQKNAQDALVGKIKDYKRQISLRIKGMNKKATAARHNAKIAIKRGEEKTAETYLVQFKQYQNYANNLNKTRLKLDSYQMAIETGGNNLEFKSLMKDVTNTLEKISQTAGSTEIGELTAYADEYAADIHEAQDMMAGEPTIDTGIDVSEEMNKLQTEVLLDESGSLPEVPSETEEGKEEYITDLDALESEKGKEVKSKEQVKKEVDKLKKELNIE
ncbi:MAG: Snf7 family protein [Promethearchaeia archaeon]